MDDGLQALFDPAGVAIVGASSRPGSFSRHLMRYLTRYGYAGKLTAVNPKAQEIDGVPCVASLTDIAGSVDLALVFVPAAQTLDVMEECGRAGVKSAVVYASGFREIGADGAALEAQIQASARRHGVRLLGPNCQGLIHRPTNLVATFSASARRMEDARLPIGYVGQSGALGGVLLDLARAYGVSLSTWVTTGNQVDVDVTEVARHLVREGKLRSLALYLEAMPDGDAWQSLLREATAAGIGLALLRAGESARAREAVASHTGALVSDGAAFHLLNAAAGVVEVHEPADLLLASVALMGGHRPSGRGVGVVTSSGGAGALVADQCERVGLRVPSLAPATEERLATLVPTFGSTINPIDVTANLFAGDAIKDLAEICRIVAADESIDALVLVVTNTSGDFAADLARRLVDEVHAPMVVCWPGSEAPTAQARAVLVAAGHATTTELRAAVELVAALDASPSSPSAVAWTPDPALRATLADGVVTESGGAAFLDRVGLRRPAALLTVDAVEGARFASTQGAVALKVQSPDILHKADVGALRLGVAPDAVEASFAEVLASVRAQAPDVRVEGLLVQAMVGPGVELFVGITGPSRGFPCTVTVGSGGRSAERRRDVATAIGPLDAAGVLELLRRLQVWPELEGRPGIGGADVDAATRAIAALSVAAAALGEDLEDLEVNPLVVHPSGDGVTVVDFLARLR